jgi:hypothetical protein
MTTKCLAWRVGTALATAFSAFSTLAQSDNFNANNDTGWTRMSPLAPYGAPGTYTLANGQYRIQAAASPLPGTVGPGRAGSLINGDGLDAFQISVDLVTWNDSLDQVFGILARVAEPGLGTLDGYALTYANEQGTTSAELDILRIRDENSSGGTQASVKIRLIPGQGYRLVFTGIGAQLTGEVYALTNLTTPLATITASNVEFASGACGLFVYDNSTGGAGTADATFDNFTASPPLAPLQVLPVTNQVFTIAWPDWGGEYSLQWRASAATGAWNTVLGPFVVANGRIQHSTNSVGVSRFYRLSWGGP